MCTPYEYEVKSCTDPDRQAMQSAYQQKDTAWSHDARWNLRTVKKHITKIARVVSVTPSISNLTLNIS